MAERYTYKDWENDRITGKVWTGEYAVENLYLFYLKGKLPDYQQIRDRQREAFDKAVTMKAELEKWLFNEKLQKTPSRNELIEREINKNETWLEQNPQAYDKVLINQKACGSILGSTYKTVLEKFEKYEQGKWFWKDGKSGFKKSIDVDLNVYNHKGEPYKETNLVFVAFWKYEYLQWLKALRDGLPEKDRDSVEEHVYPDKQDQFYEIEKELFNRGWINSGYEWQGEKRELVCLLKVLIKEGYFKNINRHPPSQRYKYQKHFIANRYFGDKKALSETYKHYKDKLTDKQAIEPFFSFKSKF